MNGFRFDRKCICCCTVQQKHLEGLLKYSIPFKDDFVKAVMGANRGYLIELTIIYNPDSPCSTTEPSSQLVHRDVKDGDRVTNFLITIADGYLLRFFDANSLDEALLVALQENQFVQFGTEMHQGKATWCSAAISMFFWLIWYQSTKPHESKLAGGFAQPLTFKECNAYQRIIKVISNYPDSWLSFMD